MISRLPGVAALALLIGLSHVGAGSAEEKPRPPKCPACSNLIAPGDQVVVTDFRAGREIAYCGIQCALKQMAEKCPASRAIAHCAITGKEIRIIRTGVRWVIVPDTAVFLIVDAPESPPAQQWRVFHRQAGYMQFLCRHRELIPRSRKPTRLHEVLKILKPPPVQDKPDAQPPS